MVNGLFVASSLVLITTPGPDSVLVSQLMLRTRQWRLAAAAALGMVSAGALHAALAMTGVSLLLSSRPVLFTVVQWCGATLMCLWGVKAVYGACRPAALEAAAGDGQGRQGPPGLRGGAASWPHSFLLGFLCTGANPKVGLFLLAYLPQFVPAGEPLTRSMAVLAAVHLCMAALWLALIITVFHLARARHAARRGDTMGGKPGSTHSPVTTRLVEGLAGVVFISFAVRLAFF